MTNEQMEVTIARIDERLGAMITSQDDLKKEVGLLHDTAIRIPCKNGECAWELNVKSIKSESKAIRISIKEGLTIALLSIPIVVLTTLITNWLPHTR